MVMSRKGKALLELKVNRDSGLSCSPILLKFLVRVYKDDFPDDGWVIRCVRCGEDVRVGSGDCDHVYDVKRFTPEKVDELRGYEVFVFGSNLAGRHGAGAAKQALKMGAEYGKGVGLAGQTYAIPTKDEDLNTLSVFEIGAYVDEFTSFAKSRPSITFLVTKIGCGLAGYEPEQIAPLFDKAGKLHNVVLPIEFASILGVDKIKSLIQ